MVSIFSLGPLPGRPLLLYISNLPGRLHTVAPLKLKGKTAFLPLSLGRGEWESFKKINAVPAGFCFYKGSGFFVFFVLQIYLAVPINPLSSSVSITIWFTSRRRPRIQAPYDIFAHPEFRALKILLETD